MQTARFIHTVLEGKDTLLTTNNFDVVLNTKNFTTLMSTDRGGEQTFYDDNAITYIVIFPESEPNGRSYITTDGIICKFTDSELISYLKPEEKLMLLRRVSNKLDLINKIRQSRQPTTLTKPLPEPQIKII
jgi:hypothetical protein